MFIQIYFLSVYSSQINTTLRTTSDVKSYLLFIFRAAKNYQRQTPLYYTRKNYQRLVPRIQGIDWQIKWRKVARLPRKQGKNSFSVRGAWGVRSSVEVEEVSRIRQLHYQVVMKFFYRVIHRIGAGNFINSVFKIRTS